MDVVGSEIGQKMRSAIKAKLTELGCYVDDELPDYVMVMVANKRTRAQMEDDLQLFLGDNTELFVNWLHQVLKKLQEVTVTAPLKAEVEKKKERSVSKERKVKEKKDKDKSKKSDTTKKSKKKNKEKDKSHKKLEKKAHKSKKKSKHHEMIRPNIPPLLMNMEKVSEPSITDVFAGQILKNHGVLLEPYKEDPKKVETKPVIKELKRPIIPIIDPATISQPETSENILTSTETITKTSENKTTNPETSENITNKNTQIEDRDEQIKEINQIEAKIQGLKQKLAEQLDSMSDDEDFLTIRTEAEELMNDFAEDVLQEISQPPPITPPLRPQKSPTPPKVVEPPPKPREIPKEPEILPQIELNLPKRPIRERLGVRETAKVQEVKEKETTKKPDSPERFTPEKELEFRPQRSARSRLGSQSESQRRISVSEENSEKSESSSKRLTSKVSVLENRSSARSTCASVVRVRPRPRVAAPASSLLLRAVADAHKSLLNIPPKIDPEPQKIKRAMVLPMRRCVDAQKIVIQVPGGVEGHSDSQGDTISLGDADSEGDDKTSKMTTGNVEKEDFAPHNITKVINNTAYVPDSGSSRQHDVLVDSITIHNTKVAKDKDTQFIVTMDGYHPNAFLAKKLLTEGLLEEDDIKEKPKESAVTKHKAKEKEKEKAKEKTIEPKETSVEKPEEVKDMDIPSAPKKRLSNTSDESDTQVIIKKEEEKQVEKRKSNDIESSKESNTEEPKESPPAKKRKASPIVFDVGRKEKEAVKKDKEPVRERTVSASSDSHVILSTTSSSHKYDALPPLSAAEKKLVWCRAFPLCRYGSACAFAHPRCKFAAACTRRGCVYSHSPDALPGPASPSPAVASHVVPAANYKSISAGAPPSLCKFYPDCVNPLCHFYHPKPCRYGKACANKLECNFYHRDVHKWKYSL